MYVYYAQYMKYNVCIEPSMPMWTTPIRAP